MRCDELSSLLVPQADAVAFGVPCSVLAPLLDELADRLGSDYVTVSNEGEAVAAAFGAASAGRTSLVFLQNSGLGNALNPLTSLTTTFGSPVTLVVGYRGAPGASDEPQHLLMGEMTRPILEMAGFDVLEVEAATDTTAVAEWLEASAGGRRALLVHRGALHAQPPTNQARPKEGAVPRDTAIEAIASVLPREAVLVASTGMIGRELAHLGHRSRNLYMVGSMGCAPSIAVGLAQAQIRHVVVLDGDGALAMRLEGLVGLAQMRHVRVDHVVLDNGMHETTGGQWATSTGLDFPTIARGCGYDDASTQSLAEVLAAIGAGTGTGVRLHHLEVSLSVRAKAPRPVVDPEANLRELRLAIVGDTE